MSNAVIFFQKHIMCTYLHSVCHPVANLLPNACITKLKFDWATTENFTDCGVFTMRHMEVYKWKGELFEAGFSGEEKLQQKQISNLRKLYATRIMLSDANVLKSTVFKDAREECEKAKNAKN